jgi:hypothetical protein
LEGYLAGYCRTRSHRIKTGAFAFIFIFTFVSGLSLDDRPAPQFNVAIG